MPAKTKIEWADYISNPIKARNLMSGKQGHACIKISEGCAHCWASGFNVRLGTGLEYTYWNRDKVDFFLDEKELKKISTFNPRDPFKWGRERAVVFPCDMTDLFGSWVPVEWIDRIFHAMWMCQGVDWLVLTKRSYRMITYLTDKYDAGKAALNNIYLGCSVENQKRANMRREDMRAIAEIGWMTWVSFEPALEVVNWAGWEFLNGLICGGESGAQARPMPPMAAREALNFCADHDIPFFFKQWGEWIPLDHLAWVTDRTTFTHKPVQVGEDLMVRVGKGLAGRVLDGSVYSNMPGSR